MKHGSSQQASGHTRILQWSQPPLYIRKKIIILIIMRQNMYSGKKGGGDKFKTTGIMKLKGKATRDRLMFEQ